MNLRKSILLLSCLIVLVGMLMPAYGANGEKKISSIIFLLLFSDIPENNLTNCFDGIDNDGDGFTDCVDFDCIDAGVCEENNLTNCFDGIDND